MSGIALMLSCIVIFFLLDSINDFTGKSLTLFGQSSVIIFGGILIFGLLVGLIAGL